MRLTCSVLLATLVPLSAVAQSVFTPGVGGAPTSLSVQESNANGSLTVSLLMNSGPPGGTAQWDIATVDGTAKAGEDYDALSVTNESRRFAAQLPDFAGSYRIVIRDDNLSEGDETFTLRLTSPNGSVTPTDWVITILDDSSDTEAPPQAAGTASIQSEISNHLVVQAEALLETQPRLADYAGNSGSGASGTLGRQGYWGEATFARSVLNGVADGDHLVASLGVHGRVSDHAFLGGMLQFDRTGTKLVGDGRSGKISGKGWMAGPYFVARDPSNGLHFEGRLLYGRSSNDVEGLVSGAGTDARNGSFDGERWLAQIRVAGEYPLGSGAIMYPLADLGHARNLGEGIEGVGTQGADLDDKIRAEVSKLRLGTEFEIPFDPAKGDLVFRPGLYFVVSDRDGGEFGASERASAGRVDLGVDYRLEDGVSLGFQGYYSGLGGESEFESYGAGLGLQVEF